MSTPKEQVIDISKEIGFDCSTTQIIQIIGDNQFITRKYYRWLDAFRDWFLREHGIFVLIQTFSYESPGSMYFIPTITLQRGHKLKHKNIEQDYLAAQQKNTWKSTTIRNTLQDGSYQEALEQGLLYAATLINH